METKMDKVELEELYQKCQGFDESALRMEDPEYAAVLNRYLENMAKLEKQLTEEQIGELYACVEDAQECMSFEVMHFLREGFLLGLSAQLGTMIRGIAPSCPKRGVGSAADRGSLEKKEMGCKKR